MPVPPVSNLWKTTPYPATPLPLSVAVTTNAQSVSMLVWPSMIQGDTFDMNNQVFETVMRTFNDKYNLYLDTNGNVLADHSHDADGVRVIIKDQEGNLVTDFDLASGYHHPGLPTYKLSHMPSYNVVATDPFFSLVTLDEFANKTDLINGGFAGYQLYDKYEVPYVLGDLTWTSSLMLTGFGYLQVSKDQTDYRQFVILF